MRYFHLYVLLLLIILSGCDAPRLAREDYIPHAAVTLAQNSIDLLTPTPKPKPSDGKCANCKGVGKVGDGRTMLTCEVCKGTGRDITSAIAPVTSDPKTLPDPEPDPEANVVPTLPFEPLTQPDEPKQPQQPKVVPTITVWTSDNCPPCKRWKESEAPKFERVGWTIVEIESTSGLTPRFEVSDPEHFFTHSGFMSVAAFTAKFKASKRAKDSQVWAWVPNDGPRPADMPPKKANGREFDGGPEFGNGSWAQRDEDGVWRRNGG